MSLASDATPPSLHHWAPAVRSAELISGSLVRRGPGVRPIGWPETPTVRLAAVSGALSGGNIAIGLTAAWVWGAARHPGHKVQVSVPPGRRQPLIPPPEVIVRQLRFRPEDLTTLGEYTVTTPLRTLLDIVQGPGQFTFAEVVCCRLLALRVPGTVAVLHQLINEGGQAYRSRSRERMWRVWGPPIMPR